MSIGARSHRAVLLALLAALLVPATAGANVPATKTLTNPIRVPSMGGWAAGTLTFSVAYSATAPQDKATASASGSVGLGAGKKYKVTTCVYAHTPTKVPESSCPSKTHDLTRAKSTQTVALSSASRTIARPAQGSTGQRPWTYAVVEVYSWDSSKGEWSKPLASSWPDNGLQGAAVAVIAQNETSASLPGQQGATLDVPAGATAPPIGGINSGNPDSVCTDSPMPPNGPTPGNVSTTALGTMPAYYEVGEPTGAYASSPPKGVMLTIHGGGWYLTGAGAVWGMRGHADRWRARGWRTVNLSYRACGTSVGDVLAFYDKVKATYTGKPICTLGGSAGGHLALMVAAWRKELACAIVLGGPTDLRTVKSQTAWNPATGSYDQTNGPRWGYNLAVAAFGEENLFWFSPGVFNPSARLLLATAAGDTLVPYQQALDTKQAVLASNPSGYVDTVQLAAGDQPFVHGKVSQAALDDYYQRELALVAPVVP